VPAGLADGPLTDNTEEGRLHDGTTPHSIRVNTVHPTTVATDMILNEPSYRLFRPDLDNPTREDFEVAARTLNKLPVAAPEPADISDAVLYLCPTPGATSPG
jgi:NAD(P)-dependent dehydrogenase (short-subunit alcohol dehydrogenase family)